MPSSHWTPLSLSVIINAVSNQVELNVITRSIITWSRVLSKNGFINYIINVKIPLTRRGGGRHEFSDRESNIASVSLSYWFNHRCCNQVFCIFWTWLGKNSNSKSNLLSWSPKSTWGYSTSDIGVGIDLLQGARLEDAEPAKTFNNTETGRLAYEFDESANITQLLDAGLIEMPDINMKIAKVPYFLNKNSFIGLLLLRKEVLLRTFWGNNETISFYTWCNCLLN